MFKNVLLPSPVGFLLLFWVLSSSFADGDNATRPRKCRSIASDSWLAVGCCWRWRHTVTSSHPLPVSRCVSMEMLFEWFLVGGCLGEAKGWVMDAVGCFLKLCYCCCCCCCCCWCCYCCSYCYCCYCCCCFYWYFNVMLIRHFVKVCWVVFLLRESINHFKFNH